jgi:hypothetical protein
MTDEEKFKHFAQLVDSPEKCAELCRKYLEKKGDKTYVPQIMYVGGSNITRLYGQHNIAAMQVATMGPQFAVMEARRAIIDHLLGQIHSHDMIKWDEYKDYACDWMTYRGELNVWKGDKR